MSLKRSQCRREVVEGTDGGKIPEKGSGAMIEFYRKDIYFFNF